jgi:menaquinone-specific isochorismate synthase
VGWLDARGDGLFAVALRSAVSEGRRARLFAGVGVVGDSDPDREWEETRLKFKPMLGALGVSHAARP